MSSNGTTKEVDTAARARQSGRAAARRARKAIEESGAASSQAKAWLALEKAVNVLRNRGCLDEVDAVIVDKAGPSTREPGQGGVQQGTPSSVPEPVTFDELPVDMAEGSAVHSSEVGVLIYRFDDARHHELYWRDSQGTAWGRWVTSGLGTLTLLHDAGAAK